MGCLKGGSQVAKLHVSWVHAMAANWQITAKCQSLTLANFFFCLTNQNTVMKHIANNNNSSN